MDQTSTLSNAADLAAQEAAARITDFVSDQGAAAADHLAALWHVAVACIAAVAPYGTAPADERLADCIDVALGWYPEEVTNMWFQVLEESGLV